ncbi:hypothetical protein [Absidia glauca]|uniref:Uncharacterized protein n=1 Tax=Absidia glauca TaxID=4829 RepID=A0A168RBX8_ABSGL|nr:hypothetical protein [Absidia glauca]
MLLLWGTFISLFISLVFSIEESHRVVVHHPYQHQQVISDSYIGLEYGIVKGHSDQTPSEDVQIKFEWTQHNSTASPLQLDVHQGFSMRVLGTHQQHYAYQWKTPGCPFFVRYQPHQYHFSLLFLVGTNHTIQIPLDFTLVNVTGLHCNNKMLNTTQHVHHHNASSPKSATKYQTMTIK